MGRIEEDAVGESMFGNKKDVCQTRKFFERLYFQAF